MLKRAFNKVKPYVIRIFVVEVIALSVLFGWAYKTRPTMLMTDKMAVSYIEKMSKEERVHYIENMPNKEGDRLIRLHIAYQLSKVEAETAFPESTGN